MRARTAQVQCRLQGPQRPDDKQVGAVLLHHHAMHTGDLGLGKQLGYSCQLTATKTAACRAFRHQHGWIVPDALNLAGRGVGLDQQPAVLLTNHTGVATAVPFRL